MHTTLNAPYNLLLAILFFADVDDDPPRANCYANELQFVNSRRWAFFFFLFLFRKSQDMAVFIEMESFYSHAGLADKERERERE